MKEHMHSFASSVVVRMTVIVALSSGCTGTKAIRRGEAQALAPTGRLRVAVYADDPLAANQDQIAAGGTGVLHDLSLEVGQELARHLGVGFEAIEFESQPPAFDALRAGGVDFMIINATALRAKSVDFSPELVQTEQGFLVVFGSPLTSLADVDRPNIRVGVSEGSSSQGILSGQLKNAAVIPVSTIKNAVDRLSHKDLDAFATNKAVLFALSDHVPGSRVLDGRYGVERLAIGIPKGRDEGLQYLRTFVADVKSTGFFDRAARKVRLRGTVNGTSP
jgi:polar amino acid transport system substrate-binding protein